jgi:hypothetical protein
VADQNFPNSVVFQWYKLWSIVFYVEIMNLTLKWNMKNENKRVLDTRYHIIHIMIYYIIYHFNSFYILYIILYIIIDIILYHPCMTMMEDHGWDNPRFSLDHPQALPAGPNGFRFLRSQGRSLEDRWRYLGCCWDGIDYWLYKSNMVKHGQTNIDCIIII